MEPIATVGVAELKARLSHYLRAVKAGAQISVTEHGKPIACLTPPAANGLVIRPATKSIQDLVWPVMPTLDVDIVEELLITRRNDR